MNIPDIRKWLAIASLVFAVFALPGVSIGDGISGTGFGRITQFRSLVINGEHYDTDYAIVRINGVQNDLYNLRLGQQIFALIDFDDRQVLEIDQYDAVTGKIEQISIIDETLGRMELTVAGQQIRTGLETVYHIDKPFSLAKGKHVTVGGLRDDDDVIIATALEKAESDKEFVVSGFVRDLTATDFRIGALRITSPYLGEIVDEPWFSEGAAVLVAATDKPKDGVLTAQRVIPVPAVIVSASEYFEFGDSRIDGEITQYNTTNQVIQIDGIDVRLDEETTLHDLRDHARPFGLIDIYPGDHVSLSVELNNGELRARKLVRVKKAKQVLRGKVQAVDAQSDTLTLFNKRFYDLSETGDSHFGRAKVKGEDLPQILESRDNIEVTVDDKHPSTLKKVRALPDCEHELHLIIDPAADKDTLKELKKQLQRENRRAYYCTK